MTESNEPRELLPCPTLRDALREWRQGLPMLSVLLILWIFALTLEACCG